MFVDHLAEDEIRRRAYQLYLERGRQPGYHLDDWTQAEYELLRLPVRLIAQLPQLAHRVGAQAALIARVQAGLLGGTPA